MKKFTATPEFDAKLRELYEGGASPREIMHTLGIDKPIFLSSKRRLDLHRRIVTQKWKVDLTTEGNIDFVRRWERGESLERNGRETGIAAGSAPRKAHLLGLVDDPSAFERTDELVARLEAGERMQDIAIAMEVRPAYLDAVFDLHGLGVRFRSASPGSARKSGGHASGWTPERDDELRRLRAAGGALSGLGKALGVHPATIVRRLHVLGLEVDPRSVIHAPGLVPAGASTQGATETMKATVATPKPEIVWTPYQDDRIAKLHAVGVKAEEIAKEIGRGAALVRDRIAALGLKRGSLERHPSTIIALGGSPAAKPEGLHVTREAVTAFTRDTAGIEVAATAYGVDVDRRFNFPEVRGIDDAIDRTVASLRALVVVERIAAGEACDAADVRTALKAAQAAGRVTDALVLAAWKAGVMTVGSSRATPAATTGVRRKRFSWTPELDAQLRNLWVKGVTRREIAERMGIPDTTIRDRQRKLNLPTRAWDAAAGISRVTNA